MTEIERYHQQLRELGCIACLMLGLGPTPPEIHHLFDAHERDDRLVVGLCPHHHRSKPIQRPDGSMMPVIGFHPGGEPRFRATHKFGEAEMLAETIARTPNVQFDRRRS